MNASRSLDEFGRAVAWLGDINHDGTPDYAVSSPRESGAAPSSGVVRVYSGRDASVLLTLSGVETGELFGWSIAALDDVNGDGTPDLAVGAPRSDGFTTPANTQPAKIRPVIEAMAAHRVDVVCGAGDSNHFYFQYGYNAGLQVALSQRVPCYATEVHSPNENNGLVATRWGSQAINSTGGPLGRFTEAPGIFGDVWNVDLVPATGQTLHRYAYWEPDAGMLSEAAHGLLIHHYHPMGVGSRLGYSMDYGVFASGGSSFTPEVRMGEPPYSLIQRYDRVSTGPAVQDEMRRVEFELPADPARDAEMLLRWTVPGDPPLVGPVFLLWMRAQNLDRPTGYAFSTLWAVGGRSARDAAVFYSLTPLPSLANFYGQVRRLQGPDKKVVIYIEEGGNDRGDTRPSIRARGISRTPEGYRDNMEFIKERIEAVWTASGWPLSELYFVMLGYHVLSDDPSKLDEEPLIALRQTTRDLAAEWPRSTCIDLSAMMTEAEARAMDWYTDEVHAHLTAQGYGELSRRIINSLMSPPPAPGRVRIISGANGATIRELAGAAPGDRYGSSVAAAGDLDGDGRADLAVGAPGGGPVPALVEIISAATGGLIRMVPGGEAGPGADFGASLARLGDVNGDGGPDLAIGAPGALEGAGSVFICSGVTGSLIRRIDGSGGERLGTAIAGPGDLNGDGAADVLIGSPLATGEEPGAGAARLYSGASGLALLSWPGQRTGERFGAAVAGVGDLDRDGVPDVAIGAPGREGVFVEVGSVLIASGADGAALQSFPGKRLRGHFGAALAGGVDVDDDDREDFIVGETTGVGSGSGLGADPAGIPGSAYVFSGQLSCCAVDFSQDGIVDFADYLEFLNRYEVGQIEIDFNGDGVVDFSDYLDFLSLFDSSDPRADLNADGLIDFQDYLVFLNRYETQPLVGAIDLNGDGLINFADYLEFLNLYDRCSH
ncbi:MAG: FG-GAP repeat protein [Phycisphaerales bacterium]|nr:FG-GAP repeat protein [Phycisphaerales bacterium]